MWIYLLVENLLEIELSKKCSRRHLCSCNNLLSSCVFDGLHRSSSLSRYVLDQQRRRPQKPQFRVNSWESILYGALRYLFSSEHGSRLLGTRSFVFTVPCWLIECVDPRLLGKSKRASSCVVLCIRSSPLQSIVLGILSYICVSKLLLLVSYLDASKLECGKLSKDKRFTNQLIQ